MAGRVSIHVIDVTRAVPADGMRVELFALDPQRKLLLDSALSSRGTLDDSSVADEDIGPGLYEAVFHIGDYYRATGLDLPTPAFLEDVPFRFGIAGTAQHYHLPLKMSPWGFSLFRGG